MSKKVVLITGTNSGFGYLTALGAAEKGYNVYATMRDINGRNAEKAKELQAIDGISVIELDVTDGNGVKSAIDKIILSEARLHVLVNNA
jgi:NAD(P)-dependent dehydrogenase (short-subunit alcohol dehydrogenase family)